jgi:hypothetical protein
MGAMKNLSLAIQDLLDKNIDEADIARILGCDESLVWDVSLSYIDDDESEDALYIPNLLE